MTSTSARNRTLLAACGGLVAIIAVFYLLMWQTDGAVTYRSWNATVVLTGQLALAAGLCSIAAGAWPFAGRRSWPLLVHGSALGALGVIQLGFTGYRIRFLTIALLAIAMAVSMAILELTLARASRKQDRPVDRWFLTLAGAASGAFAFLFLALGLRWIEMGPGSHLDLLGLGSYFGFSAVCLVALAVRSREPSAYALK